MQDYILLLSRATLVKAEKVCAIAYIWGKKGNIFFTEAEPPHKANQDDIRKSDAQEIKESCALSLNPKFLAADASCPPRPSQSSGA